MVSFSFVGDMDFEAFFGAISLKRFANFFARPHLEISDELFLLRKNSTSWEVL